MGTAQIRLDVRDNSLNLVRLLLALLVLVAHCFVIGGFGPGPGLRGENLGGWAVFGFFAISGYLITASRLANPLGRYLLLRVARIYPAFVVCLVVTAGVFAPIAWVAGGRSLGDGFLTTPTTPVSYVLSNLGLRITAYDVAGTPDGVPYPGAWNGSLWTLFFEFCCYLIVGLVLTMPWVRRHQWSIVALFVASVVAWATVDRWAPASVPDIALLARLLPPFLGGAVLQVAGAKARLRTPYALAAAALTVAMVAGIDHWGAQAAGPLVAYVLLWVASVLPSPRLVKGHDVSYGSYIYAFPVAQLLVLAGAHRLGYLPYVVLTTAGTALLAAVSWAVVERPALRRVRRRFPSRATESSGKSTGDGVSTELTHGLPAPVEQGAGDQGEGVRP